MQPKPGTYALILRCDVARQLPVGRLGVVAIEPGYYIYVGSAFGPGGIRARVTRHCRRTHNVHWHIDHLRSIASPVGVWISYATTRFEHEWARALRHTDGFVPVSGFGCSDCDCASHLFFSAVRPELNDVGARLGGAPEACPLAANTDLRGTTDA